mmetsp:Transcript_16595/g.31363  ORF Transcript_16595/g.31363 Transcript_16595/m.31363 type:complete len:156 (+) Transcript_16595:87-554(+)
MPAVPIVYFAVATGLVWLMFLVMAAVRACKGDFGGAVPGHVGESQSSGTARSAEEKAALVKAIEMCLPEVNLNQEITCPVCLDVVCKQQPARRLDCQHAFHSSCISGWLTHGVRKQWDDNAIQCPVCRHMQVLQKPLLAAPTSLGVPSDSSEIVA